MGSPSFFMSHMIPSVLFRYLYGELTVLYPAVSTHGYRIGQLRVYPPIPYALNGDLYYDPGTQGFYRYSTYQNQNLWVKVHSSKVPKEIRAWCLATNRSMKD